MQDDEFCIKYARVIIDSPLSQIVPLCEAFKRAFNLDRSAEDLAKGLVDVIREATTPQEALKLIEVELLTASTIQKHYFEEIRRLQEERKNR